MVLESNEHVIFVLNLPKRCMKRRPWEELTLPPRHPPGQHRRRLGFPRTATPSPLSLAATRGNRRQARVAAGDGGGRYIAAPFHSRRAAVVGVAAPGDEAMVF